MNSLLMLGVIFNSSCVKLIHAFFVASACEEDGTEKSHHMAVQQAQS